MSTDKRAGEQKPPRRHRRYSEEFKTEAIRLVRERERRGLSLRALGRELGVGPGVLWQWANAASRAGEADPHTGETLEEEVRRLRREVTVLRQEREFAKKAAAFFAKESL